ncbi:hypothetical protein DYB28_005511 [Aphanomyces astaci]|uniref:Uncharacterized protein n=1 Tax=Aphanomyces astaci TaxID=112090 RepID=A0A9X8HCC4_APHAT|nr:hypothetical protein DYB28_005511 [Aphanomyces astaci]
MFSAWVNTALPVMRDALKKSPAPLSGVTGADVVEASPDSGDKGSTPQDRRVPRRPYLHPPRVPRNARPQEGVPGNGKSLPWEQYKAQESFIHSSWRQLPLWAELQEQLEDFWENHALAHCNRRFMRGSAEVNAEAEAAMGPLVGIIGCLYRIVRLYRTDLLPPFILAGLPSRWDLFEDDGLGPGCSSRAGLPVISRLGILGGDPAHFSRRAVRSPRSWPL